MPPRRFWLFNAGVWSAYVALSLMLGAAFVGVTPALVLISVSLGLFLCLVSGGIRGVAARHGWWQLGGWSLSMRLLAAVAAGTTLAQLGVAAVLIPSIQFEWVEVTGGMAAYRPAATLTYWLNTAVVLTLWTGVWAGAHSVRRARRSELARLRAEAQRSMLERDALKARLNPHFVFNALNNLRALINEDPIRARELVTRLSNTLRHALEHAGTSAASVEQELAVVDDYLAVEAVHFEERLRVTRDVPANTLDATLPAMALQLLVENAIKHGIAVLPGGGEITIALCREANVLQVVVTNPLGPTPAPAGHGVGLAYLQAQLGSGTVDLQQRGDRMVARLLVPQ
ncbi:MAG: histidine kinase [Lysobacter sp.]